jgi:hypothetical protein
VVSVPDPILLRKPGSAGNRTRASGSVAYRGGLLIEILSRNLPQLAAAHVEIRTSYTSQLRTWSVA